MMKQNRWIKKRVTTVEVWDILVGIVPQPEMYENRHWTDAAPRVTSNEEKEGASVLTKSRRRGGQIKS